jgi:hypothetical protein
MNQPTIGTVDGRALPIDTARLLETRALITASSGWGKSWALRRVIEQTHGHGAMQIVIDPEGEFASLRERFDFVIAGKGGDCPAEPRSASLLARRLLELGTSAVLDLYELRAKPAGQDHIAFVRHFLEAMISAPKELWRPVLVFVDEAHMFAPEKGEAQSRDAVRGLMTLGRKRGFCGALATQRIAKLDKDACDAGNVFVGRFTLDVDVDRAGDFLGFAKARRPELRRLERGEFFVFGPALSEDLVRVKVGDVSTTHPKAGQRAAVAPAPRKAVLKMLEQLKDLPAEAENELKTVSELRGALAAAKKRAAELERELQRAQEAKPTKPGKPVPTWSAKEQATLERLVDKLGPAIVLVAEAAHRLEAAAGVVNAAVKLGRAPATSTPLPTAPAPRQQLPRPAPARPVNGHRAAEGFQIGNSGMRRMLVALCSSPAPITASQLAMRSIVARRGGTFRTYLGKLLQDGLAERVGERLAATDLGRGAVGDYEPLPTGSALLAYWIEQLGQSGAAKMLSVLGSEYPNALSRDELGERTGIAVAGGTFRTYVGKLKTLELVEGKNELRASADLFD